MKHAPKAFREHLARLKAEGTLDDPKFKAALETALQTALEANRESPPPSDEDLKMQARELSKLLGRPVSPIDLAASFQFYGSEGDRKPVEGAD